MAQGRGKRGRNRSTRKKGRPSKQPRNAQRARAQRRPTRRGPRAILIKAMAHPLRRRLLHGIKTEGALTPGQLAKAFGLPLAVVIYHSDVLHRCGAVDVAVPEDG